MLKAVCCFLFIVYSFLLVPVFLPVQQVQAAAAKCIDSGLSFDPFFFPENTAGPLAITFTVNNINAATTLAGKNLKLYYSTGILPGSYYYSAETQLSGKTFTLNVDDPTIKGKGSHPGSLYWQPDPSKDFVEFCSGVDLQIGAANTCLLDPSVPQAVPPNSTLPAVKFLGKADKHYQINLNIGSTSQTKVSESNTDHNGQGVFNSVPMGGKNGDTVRLVVISFDAGASGSCYKDIKISSTAPSPETPGTGPVIPGGPQGIIDKCKADKNSCSKSAPVPCPGGAGILTAIGCIPTEPGALVQGTVRFFSLAAGGAAFVQMILGALSMMTSEGEAQSLQAGREKFYNSIIGLLFVIFAVLLLQIIGVDILGLPGFT